MNQTETTASIGLQFVNNSNHVYHRIDIGSRELPLSLKGIELMGVAQILASGVLYFSILSLQCESDTRLVWRCADRDQVVSGKCMEYNPFEDRVMCNMYGEDSAYRGDVCCFEECCGHYPVDCMVTGLVTAIVAMVASPLCLLCYWKCKIFCRGKSQRHDLVQPRSNRRRRREIVQEEEDSDDENRQNLSMTLRLVSWLIRRV